MCALPVVMMMIVSQGEVSFICRGFFPHPASCPAQLHWPFLQVVIQISSCRDMQRGSNYGNNVLVNLVTTYMCPAGQLGLARAYKFTQSRAR